MIIHQFLPVLLPYDAVGHTARVTQDYLQRAGVTSEIFVEDLSPTGSERARHFTKHRPQPGELAIYHYANYSPLADWLFHHHPNALIYYHNLTPESYFLGWDAPIALAQLRARRHLAMLAPIAQAALSDSEYNAAELIALGYPEVYPVGLFTPQDNLITQPTHRDSAVRDQERELRGNPLDWLFVGRLVPNKAQERLIAALAIYRHTTQTDTALTLVGKAFRPAYLHALGDLADRLGVGSRVRFLTGGVDDATLASEYRQAQLFISASHHEGFGVPFLEAMRFRMPIVAYGSSAIPETVGNAAILTKSADPTELAAGAVTATDPKTRALLQERGMMRLAKYQPDIVWSRIIGALADIGYVV
ncbi:MAG: glycosyltransferase [Ferrimicrobium sp.]